MRLSVDKQGTLVDFLSSYPTIVSKGLSNKVIANGFIFNGMVNMKKNFSPDIYLILNTCYNTKYIRPIMNAVRVHFKSLYK